MPDATSLLSSLGVSASTISDGDLAVHSPIDGRKIGLVKNDSPAAIDAKIARADAAFHQWRSVPAPRRGELVRLLGEELRRAKDDLGRLVTLENGKIL
jgi:aldehyde dehydrogenase (NAD+)